MLLHNRVWQLEPLGPMQPDGIIAIASIVKGLCATPDLSSLSLNVVRQLSVRMGHGNYSPMAIAAFNQFTARALAPTDRELAT